MLSRLLRKNISPARIAGFVLSNFLGLVIVLGAMQFYRDARSIWTDEDSFIKTDYLVVNKRVTSSNTVGAATSGFTEEEIADLERQPWVRSVGRFSANDYRVLASVNTGNRGMSTYMFFEAIPDNFVDVPLSQWAYREGSGEVPIILSKDYLALYNFGFASSAGLPQISEGMMSGIPLSLRLTSEDGTRSEQVYGRVAGFSNRLNTILVPQRFMDETNRRLGTDTPAAPSRLIVDVSSPGDIAITRYLDAHDLELAGDKSASRASYLLKVVIGIVLAIGGVITILSLFILMLSVSLLMEKSRDKIHSLLMLGYDLRAVAYPYCRIIACASAAACLLAFVGVWLMRLAYLDAIEGLGAHPSGAWLTLAVGLGITLVVIMLNIVAVRRRLRNAWSISA